MRRINGAAASFSGLVVSPTRRIWSLGFFKQHQELFVAGRAEQGRFSDAAPGQIAARSRTNSCNSAITRS